MRRRLIPLSLVALAFASAPANAAAPPKADAGERTHGHPKVTLDRLELGLAPAAAPEESYLRDLLARQARRADWGAGRGSHIEYRFRLDEFTVVEEGGVLRVGCTASGWLPKSQRAKSHLTFGGDPKDRKQLVEHVLEIVSSGVITRLAEMERKRRHAP